MPRYPFIFVQADALEYVAAHGQEFDVIHASPPCQAYTKAGAAWRKRLGKIESERHPALIEPLRLLLVAYPVWVIENTPGAPLLNPIVLCGLSFGLNVKRHRLFESSVTLISRPCGDHSKQFVLVYGGGIRGRTHQIGRTGNGPILRRPTLSLKIGQDAMGIGWMNRKELSEAIPPAYTEWIGRQLLAR